MKKYSNGMEFTQVGQKELYEHTNKYNDTILMSYNSLVALIKQNGEIILGSHHDYSSTTSKQISQYLGIYSNERKAMIKSGKIKVLSHNDFEQFCYERCV